MFEKNVGTNDRIIRFVLGIILLTVGIYLITSGTATLGYVLSGVSIIPFFTAAFSTCPLYSLFGLSTNSNTA